MSWKYNLKCIYISIIEYKEENNDKIMTETVILFANCWFSVTPN